MAGAIPVKVAAVATVAKGIHNNSPRLNSNLDLRRAVLSRGENRPAGEVVVVGVERCVERRTFRIFCVRDRLTVRCRNMARRAGR